MRAEIIAVGSEMLIGGRVETNSQFLTHALASIGIDVGFKTIVGDVQADIAQAIRHACQRASLIVITGGLGPTLDDCTREAVALAVGVPLRRRAEALKGMRARFAQWGRVPGKHHERQGRIPVGADVLKNPVGSASGFLIRFKKCPIIVLPGVPSEAQQMFQEEAVPRLLQWMDAEGQLLPIYHQKIHTFGLVESDIQQKITKVTVHPHVQFGLLASPLGVTVSLTALNHKRKTGARVMRNPSTEFQRLEQQVRKLLGPIVYGSGAETMEEVVGRLLLAHNRTLAVAESCTGGLIGHRLTQVAGSSAYFERGVVCYSNQAKQDLLGVPARLLQKHGAVSQEVAAVMAKGLVGHSRADLALSTTGIAGPGGGSREKPVGLVYVGLYSRKSPKTLLTRKFLFHGDRNMVKLRASQAALNLLREFLLTPGRKRTRS